MKTLPPSELLTSCPGDMQASMRTVFVSDGHVDKVLQRLWKTPVTDGLYLGEKVGKPQARLKYNNYVCCRVSDVEQQSPRQILLQARLANN